MVVLKIGPLFRALSLIFTVLLFDLSIGATYESVPAVIWDSHKNTMDLPSGSLQLLSQDLFQSEYVHNFKSPNVLLLLLDELSIEDFSSDAKLFMDFPGFSECGNSAYIPSLETKDTPIESSFDSNNYEKLELAPGSLEEGVILPKDKKNLIVIELRSSKTELLRHNSLKESLEIMKKTLQSLKEDAFTVMFTGRKPFVKLEEASERRRISRSLQQAPSPGTPGFLHTDCVNMYLTNDIEVRLSDGTSYLLPTSNILKAVSDCQNKTRKNSMLLMYNDLPQHHKVQLSFNFGRRSRGWALDDMVLSEMIGNKVETILLAPTWKMETVPVGKSYSCGDTWVLKSNSTVGGLFYTVVVKGIQVEAFTNGQVTFSTAFDCVGFFTIPILTGVLTGILLVLILLIGMYMLSEIKTMDRFDDPKGKHIMAHAGANE